MNPKQPNSTWDSQIAGIFNKDTFSDIKFIVGQERTEFCGHKLLLALRSSVFAETFHGGTMKEMTTTLVVPDVQSNAFRKMLKYIYTNVIHFNTLEDAYAISIVAKKYELPTLQMKCQEYVNRHIVSPETACKMFEIATSAQLQFNAIENLCRQIFIHQTKSVLQSRQFLEADIYTVAAILKNDSLAIDSEFDILEAVLKWGSAQCRRGNQSVVEANIRLFIQPLLKHVRFLAMPLKDLQVFFETSNILNAVEVCSLICAKLQPSKNIHLPEIFCSLTQSRFLPTRPEDTKDEDSDQFYDCEDTSEDHKIREKISNEQGLQSEEDIALLKSSDPTDTDTSAMDTEQSCNLKCKKDAGEKQMHPSSSVCSSSKFDGDTLESNRNSVLFMVDSNENAGQSLSAPSSVSCNDDINSRLDSTLPRSDLCSLSAPNYFRTWQSKFKRDVI